jgi:hypothetical protein
MRISQFYYPSEIELVTGFGKEQLRKWRQRFGFPPKESNFSGETAYSLMTVNQLLLIKRLLEAGKGCCLYLRQRWKANCRAMKLSGFGQADKIDPRYCRMRIIIMESSPIFNHRHTIA